MATKLAFTTMRDDQGKPLFWRAHWQRLLRSCEYFSCTPKLTESQLYEQLVKLWSKSSDTIVRVDILEGGEFELSHRPITCRHSESLVKLTLSQNPLSERSIPSWLKSGDYTSRLNQREQARQNGFDEVLYLDEENHVCEASVSNLIWLKDRKLHAPKVSKYFLQGIASSLIQERYPSAFSISAFPLESLLQAEAAWIINAVTGPQRIGQIDEITYARSVPQLDLDQLYWELVKRDRDERK